MPNQLKKCMKFFVDLQNSPNNEWNRLYSTENYYSALWNYISDLRNHRNFNWNYPASIENYYDFKGN